MNTLADLMASLERAHPHLARAERDLTASLARALMEEMATAMIPPMTTDHPAQARAPRATAVLANPANPPLVHPSLEKDHLEAAMATIMPQPRDTALLPQLISEPSTLTF
jgi:hypothetical protein